MQQILWHDARQVRASIKYLSHQGLLMFRYTREQISIGSKNSKISPTLDRT